MAGNKGHAWAQVNLLNAQKFLERNAGEDPILLAVQAEKRAKKAKKPETRRAWLTVANLLIVAAQDERPYMWGNEPPAPPEKEYPDDEGMPF